MTYRWKSSEAKSPFGFHPLPSMYAVIFVKERKIAYINCVSIEKLSFLFCAFSFDTNARNLFGRSKEKLSTTETLRRTWKRH